MKKQVKRICRASHAAFLLEPLYSPKLKIRAASRLLGWNSRRYVCGNLLLKIEIQLGIDLPFRHRLLPKTTEPVHVGLLLGGSENHGHSQGHLLPVEHFVSALLPP